MRKKSIALKPTTGPCAVCAGPMKHIRTIPAAGFMSEMHSFCCTVCGCPRTKTARTSRKRFRRPNAPPPEDSRMAEPNARRRRLRQQWEIGERQIALQHGEHGPRPPPIAAPLPRQ